MSSIEDGELKGGHPPAVKAGGMRIIQHKLPREEREVKPAKEAEESKPSTRVLSDVDLGNQLSPFIVRKRCVKPRLIEKARCPPKQLLISGVLAKGNADFPPEAVQKFHEKPMPTHEPPRHFHNSRPVIIQQPRK
ncbi:death-associated protein 1 [Leptopilina heterotoma]|uniref:death-associated protein 1 n=1 Tax=Leptopilina heterotoma TaxID=63436 RepID=UPI001CA922CC|nr:death-associated protein 1 [Leptopilina heterotoma]